MQRFPKALQHEIYSFLPFVVSKYLQTNDIGWVIDSPQEFNTDLLVTCYESFQLNPEFVIRRACETNDLQLLKRLLTDHPHMDINTCITGHHHDIVQYLFHTNRVNIRFLSQQCLKHDNVESLEMFFLNLHPFVKVSPKVFWWGFERGYFMQCVSYDERMLDALWTAKLKSHHFTPHYDHTEPLSFFASYLSKETCEWGLKKWKQLPTEDQQTCLSHLTKFGSNVECMELHPETPDWVIHPMMASNVDVLRWFDSRHTDWQDVVENLLQPQTREMLAFYESKFVQFTSEVLRKIAECTDYDTFTWFHQRHTDVPLQEICAVGQKRGDLNLVHYAWQNGCCQDTIVYDNKLNEINWKFTNAETVLQILQHMSYDELKLKYKLTASSFYPFGNSHKIDSEYALNKIIIENVTRRDNVVWFRNLKLDARYYPKLIHVALHHHAWLILRYLLNEGILTSQLAQNKRLNGAFHHHIVHAPKYLTRHFDISDVSRYYCVSEFDAIDDIVPRAVQLL